MTEKSKWEEVLEEYRKLKEEGRLGEVDDIPEEIHAKAEGLARFLVRPG